jgi:hypothetical protein
MVFVSAWHLGDWSYIWVVRSNRTWLSCPGPGSFLKKRIQYVFWKENNASAVFIINGIDPKLVWKLQYGWCLPPWAHRNWVSKQARHFWGIAIVFRIKWGNQIKTWQGFFCVSSQYSSSSSSQMNLVLTTAFTLKILPRKMSQRF